MHRYQRAALALPCALLLFANAALADTSSDAPALECAVTAAVARGHAGANVAALQNFLRREGLFRGATTGVYGPKTFAATVAFQRAHGVPPTGYVGNVTRALIASRCAAAGNGGSATGVKIYSLKPISGPIGTDVTIDGSGFTRNNIVHFGSGVVMHVPVSGQIAVACTTDPGCVGGVHQMLHFTVPSSLDRACRFTFPVCAIVSMLTQPGPYQVSVENEHGTSGETLFTVTTSATTTPVAHIDSLSPAAGSAGTIVTIRGSGFAQAPVVRFGEGSVAYTIGTDSSSIAFAVPQDVGPYCAPNMMCARYLRRVTPGAYDIYLQNPDGTLISNKLTFTVIN